MSIPTHDITCRTRANQIICPDCKEKVWFFSCSCGTKVFFNDLGFPWEKHNCREFQIREILEFITGIEYMTVEEVYNLIIKREKYSGILLDEKTMDIIESIIGKRKSKLVIKPSVPLDENTEITGRVMELNESINIFTRLKYDAKNAWEVKILGKIGSTTWASARIRTNPDRRNQCLEFEVLIDKEYLKSNKLKKADFILGIASGINHVKGTFWQLIKHDVYQI